MNFILFIVFFTEKPTTPGMDSPSFSNIFSESLVREKREAPSTSILDELKLKKRRGFGKTLWQEVLKSIQSQI